jgi:3-oxoacyl-[acyl-carrier protein] reductase
VHVPSKVSRVWPAPASVPRLRSTIVTGASSGIGAAVCRRLAGPGRAVLVHARKNREGAERTAAAVRAAGGEASVLLADLAEPGAAARLLDAAGPVSILVNNAAHSTRHGWAELDAATLDAHYAVNVRAPALLAVELVRRLPASVPGRIVNLVSGQDLGPMPEELAYATTKGALETFARQFAAEVMSLGITVNAVNPGPTDTGWMDEATKAEALARTPAGRPGQPEDAARLIAWLCSEDAGWVTGQVISSEGGFVRG